MIIICKYNSVLVVLYKVHNIDIQRGICRLLGLSYRGGIITIIVDILACLYTCRLGEGVKYVFIFAYLYLNLPYLYLILSKSL